MGLFRASNNTSGQRPKASNVRGRISGPMPMDDEFPIRNPGTGVAREGEPGRSQTRIAIPSTSALGDTPDPDVAHGGKTESNAEVSNGSAALQSRSNTHRSTIRYSTMSYGTSDNAQPDRKSSSIRSALSRIFGRKKKDSNPSLTSRMQSPGGLPAPIEHQESESSTPSSDNVEEGDGTEPGSMPITDFDRALRSHSIGPDDMIAIESARNSVQVEPNFSRRRATTMSFLSTRGRDTVGHFGLSPRPASAQGPQVPLAELQPDDIGRAVTSDIPDLPSKRRSRSLSQLRGATDGTEHIRSRSDEINYWRQSYDPLAQDASRFSNGIESGDVVSSLGSPPGSRPVTSPQPTGLAPMNETRFAPPISLEDRIADLEGRNSRLEKLVAQLLQEQEQPRSGAHPVSSNADGLRPSSGNSDVSFGDGITYVGSVTASARPVPRPLSNGTIRGATSLPSLPREMSGTTLSLDHYTFLKALLDTERAARRMLEDQVTKLTHRISLLSSRASVYPADPRFAPRLSTLCSTFEDDDDDDDVNEHDESRNHHNSNDNYRHPAHDPYSAGSELGYTESEAFRTPAEEHSGYSFGADGDNNDYGVVNVDEDDDDAEARAARKRAPRTHSLGQLTQKVKPPALGVDF